MDEEVQQQKQQQQLETENEIEYSFNIDDNKNKNNKNNVNIKNREEEKEEETNRKINNKISTTQLEEQKYLTKQKQQQTLNSNSNSTSNKTTTTAVFKINTATSELSNNNNNNNYLTGKQVIEKKFDDNNNNNNHTSNFIINIHSNKNSASASLLQTSANCSNSPTQTLCIEQQNKINTTTTTTITGLVNDQIRNSNRKNSTLSLALSSHDSETSELKDLFTYIPNTKPNNNHLSNNLVDEVRLLKDIIGKLTSLDDTQLIATNRTDASSKQLTFYDTIFNMAKSSINITYNDYQTYLSSSTQTGDIYPPTTKVTTTSTSIHTRATLPSTSFKNDILTLILSNLGSSGGGGAGNSAINTNANLNDNNHGAVNNASVLSVITNARSGQSDFSNQQAPSSSITIGFIYSLLIITSLVSNPLLIYVLLWCRKQQIKLIDIFVANLSLSDLFLTIFNIPLGLIIYFSERWPFSWFVCKLGTFSTSCSIYVNIFTMAYISIDRYFAVTRPLISNPLNYQLRKKSILVDNQTRHKIYLVLAVIWLVSIVLSVPQTVFSELSDPSFAGILSDTSPSSSSSPSSSLFDLFNLSNSTNSTFKSRTMSSSSSTNELNDAGDQILLEDLYHMSKGNEYSMHEDPYKHCILVYPYKHMKLIMVVLNSLMQYLIPSVIILYFYGKIIYHLYLNLNVEELMDSPAASHHNHGGHNFNQQQPHHNGWRAFSRGSTSISNNSFTQSSVTTTTGGRNNSLIGGKRAVKKFKNRRRFKKLNEPTATSTSFNLTRLSKTSNDMLTDDGRLSERTGSVVTTTIERKRSRMRIEGINRTRNLKKSIKVMIIIIALFLLSWLPINVYRVVTTFHPVIMSSIDHFFRSGDLNVTKNSSISCLNSTTASGEIMQPSQRDCFYNVFISNKTSANYKINTLHNRYLYFLCYFLAMCSVCYNPIVYFWMHKKFRAEVKQLFRCLFLFRSASSRHRDELERHMYTNHYQTTRTSQSHNQQIEMQHQSQSQHQQQQHQPATSQPKFGFLQMRIENSNANRGNQSANIIGGSQTSRSTSTSSAKPSTASSILINNSTTSEYKPKFSKSSSSSSSNGPQKQQHHQQQLSSTTPTGTDGPPSSSSRSKTKRFFSFSSDSIASTSRIKFDSKYI